MTDLCACEHPTCPELPLCDGCDPPRVATWHGHGVYACNECVDPLLELTPGRPLLVTCAGWQGEVVVCLVAPLRPDEEAELRAAYTGRPPYWQRDWNNLALLSALDAARRERDAARRMAGAAIGDLHRALCDGAFRLDRDPLALEPVFRALQDQFVSCGWARDAVRRWLAGLPIDVPEYPTEDLTFDEADALDHLQRTAAGLEYDADGRAHILDTDVAYLNGTFHKLREKAAACEQEHAIRVNLGAQLLTAGDTIAALRQQIAELRANVDPSR